MATLLYDDNTNPLSRQDDGDFLPLTQEDLDHGLSDEQFAWICANMNVAIVAPEPSAEGEA